MPRMMTDGTMMAHLKNRADKAGSSVLSDPRPDGAASEQFRPPRYASNHAISAPLLAKASPRDIGDPAHPWPDPW